MATTLWQQDHHAARPVLEVWRKVFAFTRPHRRTVVGLVLSSTVLAGMDAVLMLVPRGVINALTDAAYDRLQAWLLAYVGITSVFCVLVCVFIRQAGKIATHVAHDIRSAGFARLQALEFAYFDVRPTGWLVARLTSDCSKLARILAWGTLELAWGVCFVAGLTVIMLVVNWRLGLLVLLVLPPLAGVSLWFQRRMLRTSRAIRRENANITAAYNESIPAVRTTKALVREDENLREFQAISGSMWDVSILNALYAAAYLPIVMTIGSVGVAMALWRGGVQVGAGMNLGDFVLFISCAADIIMPIQELAAIFAQIQMARAAAERIVDLLETEPGIKDSPEVRAAIARIAEDAENGRVARPHGTAPDGGPERIDRVEFDHVSFAYKPGEPVLADFSLAVSAGQTVALVGPTGGGKTTIVSVLCRFYEPTSGQVLVNGTDYRRRGLSWFQSRLAVVLQTPHLFSGTVRENIRYGRLDATDAEIERAARAVSAHDFIAAMPGGYDAQVGEGGSALSTGQRQLVSFARAVLADPQIFVMDEATSSIDTETEQRIQQGIAALLAGRISFVIAHRLSTIRRADRILVIEGGRIVESGTHAELVAPRGPYYELYTRQFAAEREADLFGSRGVP
jgi:ATP-binding cassette subfamily B protein